MKRILLISVALLLCLGACASGYSSGGGRSSGGSVDKQRPGAFYQDDWKPGQ